MSKITTITYCFMLTFASQQSFAQQDPDGLFRPITSNQLITVLPPRTDSDKLLGDDEYYYYSDSGSGCPDSVYIGSIEDEADVNGNVDINVNIDGNIYIKCGL